MISEKMTAKLNEQLNLELASGYLYLSMAAWFASESLSGFAHWFFEQAKEEQNHAQRIFNYLDSVDVDIDLKTIEGPDATFKDAMDICEQTYAHEQFITAKIRECMDLAQDEKDYNSIDFLWWFVEEQIEEEESTGDLLARLKMAGKGCGLLRIDKECAKRSVTEVHSISDGY